MQNFKKDFQRFERMSVPKKFFNTDDDQQELQRFHRIRQNDVSNFPEENNPLNDDYYDDTGATSDIFPIKSSDAAEYEDFPSILSDQQQVLIDYLANDGQKVVGQRENQLDGNPDDDEGCK